MLIQDVRPKTYLQQASERISTVAANVRSLRGLPPRVVPVQDENDTAFDKRVLMESELVDDYQCSMAELREMTDEELQGVYDEFKHFKLIISKGASHV